MKHAAALAISLLALTTVVASAIAWQQYQRAERLAAEGLGEDTPQERDPDSAGGTEADAGGTAFAAGEPTAADEAAADDAGPSPAGSSPRGRPGHRLAELLENPEFASAWQTQQEAQLDRRYAALFRRLNLGPDQIERLKALLAERETSRMDVLAAARAQGMVGRESRDEIRALMQQTQQEIDAAIRDTIGPAAFNQFQAYERTAAERSTVEQLEQRLSYSGVPLTGSQAETLVNILSETGGAGFSRSAAAAGFFGPGPGAGASGAGTITDATLARAQGLLTPAQLEALRQVQAEQQAQRRVSELMRQQFQREREAATGGEQNSP